MNNNTPSYRVAIMVKRLEALLINNLFDGEFITLRIAISDSEGRHIRLGKISELDELNRGEHG